MKKALLFLIVAIILLASSSAFAWTGRMNGMANPQGLVTDESDFLAIPSLLARGDADKNYFSYEYGYTDIGTMQGNYVLDTYNLDGTAYSHNFTLGGTRSFDFGRMGLFLNVALNEVRADGYTNNGQYDADIFSDLQNFDLTLYYANTWASMDIGASFGLEYGRNKTYGETNSGAVYTRNYVWGLNSTAERSMDLFILPEDSTYWKGNAKLGLSKKFGQDDLSIALGGGMILQGKNRHEYLYQNPPGSNTYNTVANDKDLCSYNMDAEVRYSMEAGDDYTVPMLLKVTHSYWRMRADSIGTGTSDAGDVYTFGTSMQDFTITIGGGVNKTFGESLVAGGVYYSYMTTKSELYATRTGGTDNSNTKLPASTEHRVTFRVAYETPISNTFTFNAGLNFWQGWIESSYARTGSSNSGSLDTNGETWGSLAALGLQYDAGAWKLESYLNLAYDRYEIRDIGNGWAHLLKENLHAKIGAAIVF